MVTKKKTTPPKAKPTPSKAKTVVKADAVPKAAATTGPEINPSTRANPAPMVRRKELVERVVASSGLKPNQVKSVLDALFSEMGKALSNGEGLNLHPLGKITVNRKKELEDREVLVCKIRRKATLANDSLGTAAE